MKELHQKNAKLSAAVRQLQAENADLSRRLEIAAHANEELTNGSPTSASRAPRSIPVWLPSGIAPLLHRNDNAKRALMHSNFASKMRKNLQKKRSSKTECF
jgi:hypothetical protein